MKKRSVKYRQINRFFLCLGLVIIVVYIAVVLHGYWQQWLQLLNPQRALKSIEHQFGSESVFNFIILTLLTSLTSALPFLSSSVLCVFNGFVFGPGLGIIMNIAGNSLGHVLLIHLMSHIDVTEKEGKLSKYLDKLAQIKNPYLALTLAYMIPFIPSFLVDYMALDSKLSRLQWFLCLLLGVTPAAILYAFGGHALISGNLKQLLLLGLVVLVLFLLYKFFERRRV